MGAAGRYDAPNDEEATKTEAGGYPATPSVPGVTQIPPGVCSSVAFAISPSPFPSPPPTKASALPSSDRSNGKNHGWCTPAPTSAQHLGTQAPIQ